MTVQEKFEKYWSAGTKDLPPGLVDFQKVSHNAAYLFAAKEAREETIRECAEVIADFPACCCSGFCENYGCHSFKELSGIILALLEKP